ncbi:hypothetical protein FRC12_010148 [Ceratobasidium sp. 428]|nr:hypothetical protein FRC09_011462 [Ceratobasidium sp. 395]KAG8791098.1 hypothetical protein FRC12_010148 [Ceratobasidium sp. 428]
MIVSRTLPGILRGLQTTKLPNFFKFERALNGYPLVLRVGGQGTRLYSARSKYSSTQSDKPPTSPKKESPSDRPERSTRRPLRPDAIIRARSQLRKFFGRFDGFKYNPAEPYMSEFSRLVRMKGWDKKGEEYKKAKMGIYAAGVKQFNKTIGTEVDDLSAWHRLFKNIEGESLPKTVEECQIRARTLQVNICDVLDAAAGGPKARDFKQERLLSVYTLKNRRKFPREHVLAGRILEFLLRHILCPPEDTECLPPSTNSPAPDNVIYL